MSTTKSKLTSLPLPKPASEIKVATLVTIAMLLDGYDMQAAAFAAPSIRADWGVEASALGPMLAAALIGMALGTAVGGFIGDRYGRRPALLTGVLTFSLFALISAFAKDLFWLTVLRFLTGIGMGAVIPNAMALVSEVISDRWRGIAMTVALAAVPCGGMVGAALSSWLIPEFGWRASLGVGGIIPLAFLLLLWAWLPESPRFNPDKNRQEAQEKDQTQGTFAILFSQENVRVTAGLWLAFFGSMLVHYSYLSWLPTLLSASGINTGDAVRGSMYFNLFGVAGSFAGSWFVLRRGSLELLLITCALITVGSAAIAWQLQNSPNYWGLIAGIAIAGCGAATLQVTLFSLAAQAYPIFCRARGIGWAAGIGRAGAILSAALGGIVVQMEDGVTIFLTVIGIIPLIVVAGLFVINRHTGPSRE
jgi:AAHS family 4-hydroxybenzoate transporter-like MFS transporter